MGFHRKDNMKLYDTTQEDYFTHEEDLSNDLRLVLEALADLTKARSIVRQFRALEETSGDNDEVYKLTMETLCEEMGIPDGKRVSLEGIGSAISNFGKKVWAKIVEVWGRIRKFILNLIGFGDKVEDAAVEVSVDEAERVAKEMKEIERLNSGPLPDNIRLPELEGLSDKEKKDLIDERVAQAKALLNGKYKSFNIEYMNHSYVKKTVEPNLITTSEEGTANVAFTTFKSYYTRHGGEIRTEPTVDELERMVDLTSYLRYGKSLKGLLKRVNYVAKLLAKREFHKGHLGEDMLLKLAGEVIEDVKLTSSGFIRWKNMYKVFNKSIPLLERISKMKDF